MKHRHWQIYFGAGLLALSALIYWIHYLIFHDAHHIFVYLVGHVAFVPIEVLLVTMVIHELLKRREKASMLQKLNMAIGVFFSEMGTELIRRFQEFDADKEQLKKELIVDNDWSDARFLGLIRKYRKRHLDVDYAKGDVLALKEFLMDKRQFLLGLLGNANLLEHESFTDLLWAVLHLTEELGERTDFTCQPASDCAHVAGDIKRAYSQLVIAWLSYMQHLKKDYPYLFSLAVRTSPFDEAASVHVS